MPDSAQILLVIVIVILTILLLVLGIQSFLMLKDLRKTLNKTNTILDDVKMVSNVEKIVGLIGTIFMGGKLGKNILDLVMPQKVNKNAKEEKDIKLIAKTESTPKKTIRRFFRRSRTS